MVDAGAALRTSPAPPGDFPVLARRIGGRLITYLDNAATSLKPRCVIDAVVQYDSEVSANIHRGKHILSEEASDRYEETRAGVAAFLGARGDEVVFVSNATHALNTIAAGLGLGKDDLVLVPLDAHHSNLLPWRCRATVRTIRLDGRAMIDLDHYADLLKLRPRVVALNHCSNVTGVYAPVAEMAAMAKTAGAIVTLDAAQSAPHRRIRVAELGVDFLALSAHKMLGPTGLGVLYGAAPYLAALEPNHLGGGTVDWVDCDRYQLRKLPHRLEAGTPNISGVYGFGAAVSYLEKIGLAAIEEHDRIMATTILAEARTREYLSVVGGDADVDRAGIVSLHLPGQTGIAGLARTLSDCYGIMCRSGHMCAQPLVDYFSEGEILRLSAYAYNTAEELRRVFTALDECQPFIGAIGSR